MSSDVLSVSENCFTRPISFAKGYKSPLNRSNWRNGLYHGHQDIALIIWNTCATAFDDLYPTARIEDVQEVVSTFEVLSATKRMLHGNFIEIIVVPKEMGRNRTVPKEK